MRGWFLENHIPEQGGRETQPPPETGKQLRETRQCKYTVTAHQDRREDVPWTATQDRLWYRGRIWMPARIENLADHIYDQPDRRS